MDNNRFANAKLEASLTMATILMKSGIIDSANVRETRDTILEVLYNYSLFPIEHTDLAITDEQEFEEYCQFYIMKKYLAGTTQGSIDQVIREVRIFHDFIKKRIHEITADDIDVYLAHLAFQNKYKKTTLRNRKAYISSFFTLLEKNRKIPRNPLDGVDPIRVDIEYEKILSKTNLVKLEENCRDYREKALLTLFLETGLRVRECSNLNIVDVNFNDKTIFVHQGKGGKDRIVPIGEKGIHMLQRYLTLERKDIDITDAIAIDKPLFVTLRYPHRRLSKDAIEEVLKHLGERCGLSRVHPHLLRKTYATTLYKQGVPLNTIAKLLGHANLETIARYVVITKSDVKKVLNHVI